MKKRFEVNGEIRNILQEAETRISGQGFQDKDFRNKDLRISGFRGLNRPGINRIG